MVLFRLLREDLSDDVIDRAVSGTLSWRGLRKNACAQDYHGHCASDVHAVIVPPQHQLA